MNTDSLVKNKSAVVGIVILLLAFFAYSIIFKSDGAPLVAEPSVEGENLVEIADELSNISFKQDIFASPGYKALIDFSAPLPSEQPGRRNPFDTLGRE